MRLPQWPISHDCNEILIKGGAVPFVFAHGVIIRKDAEYKREEQVRPAFLREIRLCG